MSAVDGLMRTKKPSPAEGIYSVSFEEYSSWDALNPSLVKKARTSPFAFRYAELHPSDSDTAALALGRAVHTCVLEPDKFPLQYVVWSGGDKRSNRAAWEQFQAANCDKSIISAEDWAVCCAMRDSVRNHPAASKLFTVPCEIERSLVWTDEATGLLCKGRFDYLGERLLDLKTARSLAERAITSSVCDYGYHISMAAYCDGLRTLTGRNADPVLLFVCKSPPYECAVRPFAPEANERGTEIWHELLETIADCRRNDSYPGFMDHESLLHLPPWEMNSGDSDITFGGTPLEEVENG